MQHRRDEILAKKAKLAELKRQRELRAASQATSRTSISPGEVRPRSANFLYPPAVAWLTVDLDNISHTRPN